MLTVAAVMREPLAQTLLFASWYLEQGATKIIICFDDPEDAAIQLLEGHANVTCVPCTAAFWACVGIAPERRFPRRQNKAIGHFYAKQSDGWFLHVDGDELVYLEGRSLAEELAQTEPDVRGVTIQPAENIQTPSDTSTEHFRLPMRRYAVRQIYGGLAGAMQKRQGLSGHTEGKTATRAGIEDAMMRQHAMHLADGSLAVDRVIGANEGAYLLHFFDQGYEVWRSKLEWRLSSSGYRGQLDALLRETLAGLDPEAALRALYAEMHVFDESRLDRLREMDAHFSLQIDRTELIAKYFPDWRKDANLKV